MKTANEILKQLGFNSTAPEGSQQALFRHLSRTAIVTSAQNSSTNAEQTPAEQQLSFDEQVLGRHSKTSTQKAR